MKRFLYVPAARPAFLGLLILGLGLNLSTAAAQSSAVPKIAEKEIKQLVPKNKGKVLMLNFWATWCPPCLEEFPAIVKLQNEYKAKGLEVIGISMNDFSEMTELQAFLRKQKPSFPIYIAGTVNDEFYKSIDKRWTSEIPLTLIYDKEGRLRYFHNDACKYEQFQKDVTSLLAPAAK